MLNGSRQESDSLPINAKTMKFWLVRCLTIGTLWVASTSGSPVTDSKNARIPERSTWEDEALRQLNEALQKQPINGVARNVILIVGDGMGMSTVTSARLRKGELKGETGMRTVMEFEKFPFTGISKTANTDKFVPDSAGAATALLCGIKTKYGFVAIDERAERQNCRSQAGTEVECVADWAIAEGKSVGFVTNTRVTHATPAPLYSHSVERYWETDGDIPEEDRGRCIDIPTQLVDRLPGRNLQVILGGGRGYFLPNTTSDPEYPDVKGLRTDNRDLIESWQKEKAKKNASYKYVWNKDQFDRVDPEEIDFLLGLFEPEHMHDVTVTNRPEVSSYKEPSLPEMAEKAIRILSKNPTGYFLLLEGGLIDPWHHQGKAVRAVSEAVHLEQAIQKIMELVSIEDTLVIVTADHSHSMVIAGHALVGTSIFGIAEVSNIDHMPYTSLLYGLGPGFNHSYPLGRQNITNVDTSDRDYLQQSAVPRKSVSHAGEDVAVYAIGPMAHLLTGVYEQQYIAHVIKYASCLGEYKQNCVDKKEPILRQSAASQEDRNSEAITRSGNGGGIPGSVQNRHILFVLLITWAMKAFIYRNNL